MKLSISYLLVDFRATLHTNSSSNSVMLLMCVVNELTLHARVVLLAGWLIDSSVE